MKIKEEHASLFYALCIWILIWAFVGAVGYGIIFVMLMLTWPGP